MATTDLRCSQSYFKAWKLQKLSLLTAQDETEQALTALRAERTAVSGALGARIAELEADLSRARATMEAKVPVCYAPSNGCRVERLSGARYGRARSVLMDRRVPS